MITSGTVQDFLQTLREEEKSEATLEKYERDIRKFLAFLNSYPVTKDRVIEYKQYLTQNYASASVNSMLIPVNRFLSYLGLHDCTVKTMKIQRSAFRSTEKELTKGEYLRLVKAAMTQGNERLALLLQTFACTGIRVSELPFITVEAVEKGVTTVTLKGKTREVFLPDELCRKLKRYASERKLREGSIFVTKNGRPLNRGNILKEMKRLSPLAKVDSEKVFPHNFRHLFACQFYEHTKDVVRLADVLGHSSINTTRIYTKVSMKEQGKEINRLGLIIRTK